MLLESSEEVRMFTDMMSEGLIVIDNEGKIQVYNQKAKEIFGIANNGQYYHDRGEISPGDIVIIGDNALGIDDGNLNAKKLEVLGIYDESIQKGDALVAIGVYKKGNMAPVYKSLKAEDIEKTLKLNTKYLGVDIGIIIDFVNKIITIQVNDEKYTMNYINSIGHMVIVDGNSKKMKFYQSNGYTARGESISDILAGKSYRAKGEDTEVLGVIGRDIFEIHRGSSTIQEFYEVAKGKNISYKDQFKEINGFPTLCSLIPLDKEGKRIGAALKVEDISEIRKVINERDKALQELEKAEKELKVKKSLNKAFPDIVGDSKEIENVKKLALKAAKTNSTVLILGESGTGKTILARAIHENSERKDKAFVHVNCGAIPPNLLESELFGYEKGAFTGARSEGKRGLFEIANGGTIFLDEIGDLPIDLQVKLLQVLQNRYFYRVGGTERVEVDVRIISASNKNLEEEMMKDRFREDLYYRISVFPIIIPPLRERIEDIYPLVENLLPKICNKTGSEPKRISAEALNLLTKYDWPGNVRELENILERAVILSENNTIFSKHIKIRNIQGKVESDGIVPLKEEIAQCEKDALKRALIYYKGDKKKAMKALQIGRTSFYEKIKKYGISYE
ncbi:MAG: sigma 54-interacting transcriptional regulator [Tissierellia bacterium]|nr:sigma 54-interacting transcriptional regulator [Tissierellia bacterium]